MEPDPESLTFSRHVLARGEDPRRLVRAVEGGRLVRPHRGSYVDISKWLASNEAEKYMWRVLGAISASRSRPIASHISAAVLHGAPLIGPMPQLIHVLATPAAGTRTEHRFRKHATQHLRTDLETRGELRLTGLIRTLVDVAVDSPFVTAIGVLDWAMREHGISADVLHDKIEALGVSRGLSRARRAINFADASAGSPGESLSRIRMHELGFPRPVLQQDFRDSRGFIGCVDFWWPEHGLIGEFDGVAKYTREEYTDGRTPAEVVIDEKRREDRLRALGHGVVRWGWSAARREFGLNPILLPVLPADRHRLR